MNIAHILDILQEECQIQPADRIIVGVSGGADSLALIHLLHASGFQAVAFHLNHRIRPEAADDAAFVMQFCQSQAIPCIQSTFDTLAYSQSHHLGTEEAARVGRYRELFACARKEGAVAVLTAHHAGDQSETILMHLIRGAGMAGLRGMQPKTLLPEYDPSIPLLRPMLDVSREEIEAYCRENQLEYLTDRTNQDSTYFRNWMRHELIPLIETKNPRFQERINHTARVLAADEEVLSSLTAQVWNQVILEHRPGLCRFNREVWLTQPVGIQNRLAMKALKGLRPNFRDFDFVNVERCNQFIANPTETRHIDLVAGLCMEQEGNTILLRDAALLLPITEYPQQFGTTLLQPGGMCTLAQGWFLQLHVLGIADVTQETWLTAPAGEAWIDADRISFPLCVRNRQPGDRLDLLGNGGHAAKISDIFINCKVPSRARAFYPVVCDSQRIIWIPDIRISHTVRIVPSTARVLHFTLGRNPPY